MGIKISELTPDANITGVEIIPVSDGGAAKSVTTGGVKDFTIDSIEGLTAAAGVTGADGVYILKGGELKPVNIDHVAQYAIDKVWGKAAENTVDAADKLPLKDGGTEKTVTAANLAAYIKGAITSGVLDISGLDTATLSGTDYLLIGKGDVAKKATLATVEDAIYNAFDDYVMGLTNVETPNDADVFYVIKSGTGQKVTLAMLKTVLGSAAAPLTTTENKVPQWGTAQKALKDGLTVRSVIRSVAAADDASLPTEKAVRSLVDSPLISASSDTGAVGLRFGKSNTEGLATVILDVDVELGGVAGVAVASIPAGSIIKSVQSSVIVAATAGGTSNRIGIGTDADKSLYGLSLLALNSKSNKMVAPAVLGGAVDIKLFPCVSGGTIGDTAFSVGFVRVRIVFDKLDSLDDVG